MGRSLFVYSRKHLRFLVLVPMGAGPNKMKVTSPSPGTKIQKFIVRAGDDDDIEVAATSSSQPASQLVATHDHENDQRDDHCS